MGVSRDCSMFWGTPYYLRNGWSYECQILYAYSQDRSDYRSKSPLKIWGKVAVGVVSDCRKFSGQRYIGPRAHRAVLFAIALLSCSFWPYCVSLPIIYLLFFLSLSYVVSYFSFSLALCTRLNWQFSVSFQLHVKSSVLYCIVFYRVTRVTRRLIGQNTCWKQDQKYKSKTKTKTKTVFSDPKTATHLVIVVLVGVTVIKNKTAELSQRRPRDAPNIWVPWKVSRVLTTHRATFPEICNGLSFRSILRMCVQNLKFVALPVPEIIGVLKKFGQSLGTPTLHFLPKF